MTNPLFVYSDRISLAGELVALAREFGQEVRALALNEPDARELVKFGADRVYLLIGDGPFLGPASPFPAAKPAEEPPPLATEGAGSRPEDYAKAMATLLTTESPAAFLVGATVRGRDIAAQVAGHLGAGLVGDAIRVGLRDGKIETDRMTYGGGAVLSEISEGFIVITISAGKSQVVKDETRSGEIVTIQIETDKRVKQVKVEAIPREAADITEAARVVCVGMGFDKKEDLSIAKGLAETLGAAIASTRPIAEDRKWLPTETCIGLSGTVVAPDLYVGLGVSGQIQHTYGVREARIIVAINNNPKATIFQVADYGIVGDLYEIVPLLIREVRNA